MTHYTTAVIVNGQKQAVDLKTNSAYAIEDNVPNLSAVNPAANQVYEDIDMD